MENFVNKPQDENSFVGNKEINDFLLQSSKWGTFLALLGFIGVAFLILIGFLTMMGFASFNDFTISKFPMVLLGFIFILIAILYLFPVTYLYKFSLHIKQGIVNSDSSTITAGFKNLKSFFKFKGIFVIVILSIYIMLLLVTLLQCTVK